MRGEDSGLLEEGQRGEWEKIEEETPEGGMEGFREGA